MPLVRFTSHLAKWVDLEERDYPGATVREVIDNVIESNPKVSHYLLEDDRSLRKHVIVFIGGEAVRDRTALSDPVRERDEIFVAQALSGG